MLNIDYFKEIVDIIESEGLIRSDLNSKVKFKNEIATHICMRNQIEHVCITADSVSGIVLRNLFLAIYCPADYSARPRGYINTSMEVPIKDLRQYLIKIYEHVK